MEKPSANVCLQDEFSNSELGVSLNTCYNCSTCTTSCPVALETEGKFNPRTIIQLANCGFEDRLVLDGKPNVWDCAMCEICQEVCPQKVNLHEIFIIVKNTAAQFENIPASYTDETTQVYENGKSIPLQAAIQKRRDQLGLPIIPELNEKEIQQLMDMTEVKAVIKKKENNPN